MQKLKQFIIGFAFMAFPLGLLHAQTTVLNQTLLTQESFNTFTPVSITGIQNWYFNAAYGAISTGYSGGQNYENEDWFISPMMDLSQMNNVQLSFSHTRGSAGVMNVGVTQGWYKVFATDNYTGDPSTTQWIEIEGVNQNISTAWEYVSSGVLAIPDAAKSEHSRIAFRYMSSATQSATWEVKNVKVKGDPVNPNGIFKITNWNTEWLGCTENGPTNEALQINNVAAAMLSMDSDIYCIQEVSNTVSSPSIQTLVSLLGSEQWGGTIVPSDTGDCNQRQGIIYKKSKVQFVSSSQMSSGTAAQGNSYYYNWSSGRYPALYNVNLVSGAVLIPISLVNIHAKAEDNDATSYTRRLGGSQALKTLLDGAGYNTKNLIIIGDFNDYLTGTTSSTCQCTVSPYKNFMDDQSHYTGITNDIIAANSWDSHPIIENIIVSDELVGSYIANSTAQETSVAESISNYHNTTSDHLPVSAMFQFPVLSNPEYSENLWTVYPNPVKDELHINSLDSINDTTTVIYDLTGRQIFREKLSKNTINVSALPSGIYILKIGNRSGKFVKE